MKRSISPAGHAVSFTCGGCATASGWNDQNARSASVIGPLRSLMALSDSETPLGHAAPCSIHFSIESIASVGSRSASGGISRSPMCFTASSNKLSLGLPGTTAAPRSPPVSNAACESTRRLDSCFAAPWHSMQCFVSSGRIEFSNRSTEVSAAAHREALPASSTHSTIASEERFMIFGSTYKPEAQAKEQRNRLVGTSRSFACASGLYSS